MYQFYMLYCVGDIKSASRVTNLFVIQEIIMPQWVELQKHMVVIVCL